jgi:hypothetical protein
MGTAHYLPTPRYCCATSRGDNRGSVEMELELEVNMGDWDLVDFSGGGGGRGD